MINYNEFILLRYTSTLGVCWTRPALLAGRNMCSNGTSLQIDPRKWFQSSRTRNQSATNQSRGSDSFLCMSSIYSDGSISSGQRCYPIPPSHPRWLGRFDEWRRGQSGNETLTEVTEWHLEEGCLIYSDFVVKFRGWQLWRFAKEGERPRLQL